MPKRKLYFDPVPPLISEDRFHKFDWEDFYRNSKEAIPDDMPNPRGKIMTTHCFVGIAIKVFPIELVETVFADK